jgi:hypothetical protein
LLKPLHIGVFSYSDQILKNLIFSNRVLKKTILIAVTLYDIWSYRSRSGGSGGGGFQVR